MPEYNAYDQCNVPGYLRDPTIDNAEMDNINDAAEDWCINNASECIKGTQWSAAFAFNSSVLGISAGNFIIMTLGACFFWPRFVGTWINFCYACCHCSAFATAIAVAFGPLGARCKTNIIGNEYEGNYKFNDSMTYKMDGELLGALGAIQAVFWLAQCCLCCFPLFLTPAKISKKDKKDKDAPPQSQVEMGAGVGGVALGMPAGPSQEYSQSYPQQ